MSLAMLMTLFFAYPFSWVFYIYCRVCSYCIVCAFEHMRVFFRQFNFFAFIRAITPAQTLIHQITILLILSLLNVNLNYPLYEPRRYQPILYNSPLWKRVDMEVPTETDKVAFDVYNTTASNFSTSVNATNGTYYNGTEATSAGVKTAPYLVQDGLVDGSVEVSDGFEGTDDKLLHIILPLSVFIAIGLFGLAVYLYGRVKKYMNEVVRNAVASVELENSRKTLSDDSSSPNSIPSDPVSLKEQSEVYIEDSPDPLSPLDSLKDIERDASNGCDCTCEDDGNTKFSSKVARAWQWTAAKLHGHFN
ncbi:hypothetical protein V1509DRAFT_618603 [Lipomyces kononenkoae]